jgi:hypothetical protein
MRKNLVVYGALLLLMAVVIGSIMAAAQSNQIVPRRRNFPRIQIQSKSEELGVVVSVPKGKTADPVLSIALQNTPITQSDVDSFKPLLQKEGIRRVGWSYHIETSDATAATVHFRPIIRKGGKSAFSLGEVIQNYEYRDGNWTLVKSTTNNFMGDYACP